MLDKPSVLASWVLAIVRGIQSYGVDTEPLLVKANIDSHLLKQHETRIPLVNSNQLWRLATQATGDPLIGLRIPEYITINTLYAVDAAAQASSTLRELIDCTCRFSQVATTGVSLSLVQERNLCQLRFDPLYDIRPCNESMDAFLAVIFATTLPILHFPDRFFRTIHVARPRPDDFQRYEQQFGCAIEYNCSQYIIDLNPELLDARLPGVNPKFNQLSEEMLINYLARFSEQDIEMKTRGAIIDSITKGQLSKSDVANRLNMSVRSLSRKLQEIDIMFSQLVDDIRQEKAINLIKQSNICLGEIAFQLGFMDTNSFSRAFRRWTGMAPGHYREIIIN